MLIINLKTSRLAARFLLAIAGFAAVALVQASDMSPLRENFCEGWQFHLGDVAGAEQPGLDDSARRTLDIRHSTSDPSKLMAAGWKPRFDVPSGLRAMLAGPATA